MKTICWILTLISLGMYLIDPWQEKINKGWIVLLYLLVCPVYFWKKQLFYPSLNIMLLVLITYYLIRGYLA
ncbi:hypothetical protein CWM47_02830 [Spirosoma pollinicola]|uniref:Uncharacterized protein n=1 Tax=Spirosoma pollinicola TaxID=2057025 RepID=A0A2K8YT77_9BACT|nr:hypothetical protein CWM47_02830 [Spirosoma pollinicola]